MSECQRVLIIGPSLNKLGGQSIQANYILTGLQNTPELTMSFQRIDPVLPSVLRTFRNVRYVRTLITLPLYCMQLLRSVRRCDVLHIFSAAYFSFLLAAAPAILLGRLFGKSVIVNYHSGAAADHLRHWPSAVRLLRLAHSIIVPSAYLVRVFRQFGLEARSIFNSVSLSAFQYRRRAGALPSFLANRNFEAHYNVACVLHAFSVIQREVPEARLTVAGDGSEREALKNLAQQLQLRNTTFLGRVAPEQMATLYNEHDVWLNASDVDNMPLSVLEAFASGVAVVSTDAGGIPDIVEHRRTGLLSARGDAPALAQNALLLLKQPTLFEHLTANGLSECDHYAWAQIEVQWRALYDQLSRRKCAGT